MPFAEYKNFKDCVAKNKDKKDPEAYSEARYMDCRIFTVFPAGFLKALGEHNRGKSDGNNTRAENLDRPNHQ